MSGEDTLAVEELLGKYSYTTPYEPGSPWSLVVALLPETVEPDKYVSRLFEMPETSTAGTPIETDLGEYVLKETKSVGWVPENHNGDLKDSFTRVRVRQNDRVWSNLDWPIKTNWYAGVAYVLKLYRKYYNVHMSLEAFEAATVESMVETILKHSSVSTLSRDVSFLILPYLTFHDRLDLLQKWIMDKPLNYIKSLASIDALTPTLLRLCYLASSREWRAVKDIIVHLKPTSETPLSLETIYEPTAQSIGFLGDLASAARILGTLCPPSFEVLAQWSFATNEVQRGIYNFYLKQNDRWSSIVDDLLVLRRTIFSKLTEQEIDDDLLIGALRKGKYTFLQTHKLESPELIQAEAANIVAAFKEGGLERPEFSTVLAALDVVPTGALASTKKQFAALRLAHSSFGVDPALAVHLAPMDIIRRALKVNPDAYNRVSELVRLANEFANEDLTEQVKEACINASLASADFSTAYSLCQGLEGPNAWLSYLQAAKFMSPLWDSRPADVAAKQKSLIVKCLQICPKSDISTVARVWENLETEIQPQTVQREPAAGQQKTRKRDHLQKLLVGGIGWAIGAPSN